MIEHDNIKELLENVEEGTIILEPQDTFNSAIIGVTHDNKHLVYDYYKIVEGFMTSEYRPIIINMV